MTVLQAWALLIILYAIFTALFTIAWIVYQSTSKHISNVIETNRQFEIWYQKWEQERCASQQICNHGFAFENGECPNTSCGANRDYLLQHNAAMVNVNQIYQERYYPQHENPFQSHPPTEPGRRY